MSMRREPAPDSVRMLTETPRLLPTDKGPGTCSQLAFTWVGPHSQRDTSSSFILPVSKH